MNELHELADVDPNRALVALRDRIVARADEPGGHADEARLAERLGATELALWAWQLTVRDDPDDVEAWRALAELHDERGETDRAAACRARAGDTAGGGRSDDDEALAALPGAGDLARFAVLFAGREGVHARMWQDRLRRVGYAPVHQAMSPGLVRAHLEGTVTLGTYLVRADDRVTTWVLDLDATPAALEAARGHRERTQALLQALHEAGLSLLAHARHHGLDPLLVDSGYKGRHLWGWVEPAVPAADVRRSLQGLLACAPALPDGVVVEVFPKQDHVPPGGLGNLVKLPLGLHLRTGRRACLLDDEGREVQDPWARLRAVRPRPMPPLEGQPTPPPAADTPAPSPLPAPPASGPAWTEADFHTSPRVAALLEGCHVVKAIIEQALRRSVVSRDEAVVLEHSLGHLAEGVAAVNHVLDRVPGYPSEARMGARHRGSPIGCARIRSRVPAVADRVLCACRFPEAPGQYDHPLRHVADRQVDRRPDRTLDELLGAYAFAESHARRIVAERDGLRDAAVSALEALPDGRWPAEGGTWSVRSDAGLPFLVFDPEEP